MKLKNFSLKNRSGKEKEDSPSSGYFSAKLLKPSSLPRTLAYWCYGILGFVLLTMFLPWTQNIRSYGYVTTFKPANRPQTIHATIAGRVEEWFVTEGEFVNKGDTIVKLSEVKEEYLDPDLLARLEDQIDAKVNSMEATQTKVEALEDQISALKNGLQLSLEQAENKVKQAEEKVETELADFSAAKTAYEIAKEQYARYETLNDKGLASEQELENYKLKLQNALQKLVSAENKLSIARRDLANARIELSSIKADYTGKISKAEAEVSTTISYLSDIEGEILKLRTKYSNIQERADFLHILAPQDANVVNTMVSGIGEMVKPGEAVVSILPANPDLAVALYVDPIDMPLIHIGTPVRLQFEGWPAIIFTGWPDIGYGTFGGRVAVIDNVATEKGKFRVLAVPDPEGKEWPDQLKIGAGAYGWMMLQDVPIWYEIWRQVNGFPPEYVEELQEEKTFEKELKYYKDEK